MELKIVNPDPKYPRATLTDPAPYGYIYLGIQVAAPRRAPFPGKSAERDALIARLKTLAGDLETVDRVEMVTVYRAALVPPARPEALRWTSVPPRFDVAVLIECSSPDDIAAVQATEPYKLFVDAIEDTAEDVFVMAARCAKRIGEVDRTRQGTFLFNHFVGADRQVALELWDHLAGWYVAETGLDNSTLLMPLGESDYFFVNHARWESGVTRRMADLLKPSFRSYVVANLAANQTVAMPILYKLA